MSVPLRSPCAEPHQETGQLSVVAAGGRWRVRTGRGPAGLGREVPSLSPRAATSQESGRRDAGPGRVDVPGSAGRYLDPGVWVRGKLLGAAPCPGACCRESPQEGDLQTHS